MANSFATKYNEEIVPALTKKFNYTSSMQVPKIDKIVLNMGVGDAVANAKNLDEAVEELTRNEFQILRVLFEHGKEVVSREALMRELWNSDIFVDDNTLSVNIARLRKKLTELGLPDLIVTKKGVGYGLVWIHE